MSDYWIDIYRRGHQQRYPWDCVVSFLFRNAPQGRERRDIRILEVGCGTASNLWFAAREGFSVTGLDLSEDALALARQRFEEDGLQGEFKTGSFVRLPFGDRSFDLVIDRAALTCGDYSDIEAAIGEISRVTKPGGRFFFNSYGVGHSSAAAGRAGERGTVTNISGGALSGLDRITFLAEEDIRVLLDRRWSIISLQRLELVEMASQNSDVHVEWRVVAERR